MMVFVWICLSSRAYVDGFVRHGNDSHGIHFRGEIQLSSKEEKEWAYAHDLDNEYAARCRVRDALFSLLKKRVYASTGLTHAELSPSNVVFTTFNDLAQ